MAGQAVVNYFFKIISYNKPRASESSRQLHIGQQIGGGGVHSCTNYETKQICRQKWHCPARQLPRVMFHFIFKKINTFKILKFFKNLHISLLIVRGSAQLQGLPRAPNTGPANITILRIFLSGCHWANKRLNNRCSNLFH